MLEEVHVVLAFLLFLQDSLQLQHVIDGTLHVFTLFSARTPLVTSSTELRAPLCSGNERSHDIINTCTFKAAEEHDT